MEKEQKAESKNQNKENKKADKQQKVDITQFDEYKKLSQELEKANKTISESRDLVKVFRQDVERIKERSKSLESELTESITINLAKKLLPILDNFEQSFNSIKDENQLKGFKIIYNNLSDVIGKLGINKIDIAKGDEFNANFMEAIFTEASEDAKDIGKVATVFQTAYTYTKSDTIVRHASVSVFN